ncbi:sulfatase-like hydrolase/transferase [Streptomyces collinus]|uniref:sulfatase-like hydrolase/transferase n=1 Tax=Streptomyces collinus TaxID=42684 RepID=UPI003822D2CE
MCQPSREALMTGMIPHRSGGIGFTAIDSEIPTFTTVLQDNGYFTAGINKLQHMQPPGRFTWDWEAGGMNGDPLTWDDRNPVLTADRVEEAMGAARAQNKPFFISCNITDPHRPFYGSPEANAQDDNQTGPYKIPHEILPEQVVIPPHLEDLPDIRKELAQYYNSVQRLDIAVGNVLDKLNASPEKDNTLVLFVSDHGMPFPFAKSTCYSSGTLTPALIKWPGMSAPRTFDALTSNIDILPTVLDLLGIDTPAGVDGTSWLPMINGKVTSIREYTFTYMNTEYNGTNYAMRGIQDHKYLMVFTPWSDGKFTLKYTDSVTGLTYKALVAAAAGDPAVAKRVKQYTYGIPLALYDLQKDPGQRVNIIDRPDMREARAAGAHEGNERPATRKLRDIPQGWEAGRQAKRTTVPALWHRRGAGWPSRLTEHSRPAAQARRSIGRQVHPSSREADGDVARWRDVVLRGVEVGRGRLSEFVRTGTTPVR